MRHIANLQRIGVVERLHPAQRYTALVYVDGLTKTKRRECSVALRRHGRHVQQVAGIERGENNALTRLADTVAGFVGDAISRTSEAMSALFESMKRNRVLIEV